MDISYNRFASLPGALTAATALTSLVVNLNDDLRLSQADAEVLQALPRLCEVSHVLIPDPHPGFFESYRRLRGIGALRRGQWSPIVWMSGGAEVYRWQ